jgi:hypothetical protein
VDKPILARLAPLHSGRDTEIDMIEREMEVGVVVIQPLEVHEHAKTSSGLFGIEADTAVGPLPPTPEVESKD